MEREAVFQFRQFAAIEVIAADRAADMRQMHANLVGASGLQPQADERAASGGLLDAVMRHGAPTVGANRAFCARAEAGNRRVDHALAPRGNALGHGEVFADEAVRVKLAGQQALGVGMAGDAQQAARALVQPIDGVIIKRRCVLTEQDGKLWFCTNNTKDVYKDMQSNPEIEISVSSPEYAWIRLHGKAVFENNMAAKEMCIQNPIVKSQYGEATNPIFEVFYLEDAHGSIADFSGNPPYQF